MQLNQSTVLDERRERRLRVAKSTLPLVVGGTAYESAVLGGFYAAGFVDLSVVATYCGLTWLGLSFIVWALYSGWSRKRSDPGLFLLTSLLVITPLVLLVAIAPQIALQPIITLFVVSAFGHMGPDRRTVRLMWCGVAAVLTVIIFIQGPHIGIPALTPAGQLLTCVVLAAGLFRNVQMAEIIRGLQKSVGEKNAALREAVGRIEILANRDELTTLPNRRSVMQSLREQIALSDRTGRPLCVALLDIDHFKRINDVCGHQTGDLVLQKFAESVTGAIRITDRLGRYGGEEFLLVLAETSVEEADEVLDRIREGLKLADWRAIDVRLNVTVTAGLALRQPGETVQEIMTRVDAALYRGKESGRNRVVVDTGDAPSYHADHADTGVGVPLKKVAAAR